MLLGLGERGRYDRLRVSDETRQAPRALPEADASSHVALSPLGIAPDDVPRHAPAVVAGIMGAWSKVPDPMMLTLCVPRARGGRRLPRLRRGLRFGRRDRDSPRDRRFQPGPKLGRRGFEAGVGVQAAGNGRAACVGSRVVRRRPCVLRLLFSRAAESGQGPTHAGRFRGRAKRCVRAATFRLRGESVCPTRFAGDVVPGAGEVMSLVEISRI